MSRAEDKEQCLDRATDRLSDISDFSAYSFHIDHNIKPERDSLSELLEMLPEKAKSELLKIVACAKKALNKGAADDTAELKSQNLALRKLKVITSDTEAFADYVKALKLLSNPTSARELASILLEFPSEPEVRPRVLAAKSLNKNCIAKHPDFIPEVLSVLCGIENMTGLRDGDKTLRYICARILQEEPFWNYEKALESLLTLGLNDPDKDVRSTSVFAFKESSSNDAFKSIRDIARGDSEHTVRLAAIETLASMDHAGKLSALDELLQCEDDHTIARVIIKRLISLGPEGIERLIDDCLSTKHKGIILKELQSSSLVKSDAALKQRLEGAISKSSPRTVGNEEILCDQLLMPHDIALQELAFNKLKESRSDLVMRTLCRFLQQPAPEFRREALAEAVSDHILARLREDDISLEARKETLAQVRKTGGQVGFTLNQQLNILGIT